MAIQTGYLHYVCDRCGKEAYLAADSAEASTWSQVQRVSVDKATSADPVTSYTMCQDCRNAYVTFDRGQDDAFSQWMGQPARDRAARQAALKEQEEQDRRAEEERRSKEIADAVADARKQWEAGQETGETPAAPGDGKEDE